MSIESAFRPESRPASMPTIRQGGVTLIELILFMVVVGVALAGIIGVMSLTSGASADPLRRKQALMIAEGLLEEVRLAGFTFCDPGSGDDGDNPPQATAQCTVGEGFGNEAPGMLRPFDNVNDYVTAANTPAAPFNDAAGNLVDALGRPLGLPGYRATVTITPDRLGDIPVGTGADTDALRIRVTVRFQGGEPVVLDGYRARYAPGPRPE